MSNPDTMSSTNATSSTEATSASGFYMGLVEAVILLIIIIVIFKFADNTIRNKIMWILLPILAFVIATGLNFGAQYMACGTTNSKNALKGAIVSPVAVLLGLGIASVESFRIPVASVFAPLFTKSANDVVKGNSETNKRSSNSSNSKNTSKKGKDECCAPQAFLTDLEDNYPLLKMFSYIFYIGFSVMFGSIVGTGIATVC